METAQTNQPKQQPKIGDVLNIRKTKPAFTFEVFGQVDQHNRIIPLEQRDRITLEGMPKNLKCRILIQVIDEQKM